MRDRLREDPYSSILTARAAMMQSEKFIHKHGPGERRWLRIQLDCYTLKGASMARVSGAAHLIGFNYILIP